MQRRRALAIAAALLGAAAFPAAADAPYPNHTVTLTVPFAPGGPGDITARYVALGLQKDLGQNFVIENKPGANGVLAAGVVSHAPPDGYSLLQISSSHTANESLIPNRGYNLMKDFDPVASLNFTELVLMVNNDLPVKTVPELIAYLKANPGKVNFGSGGNGSGYHLAAELFKSMTGTQMTHVPYKSSANARTDLIGGQIQVMFDALPASLELIRAGKMRAIATTAKSRSTVLPDLPTVAETVPGYESTIFVGLMAPKGTPPAVLDKLHDAINKVLSTPESTAYWAKQGARPMIMSRQEYNQYLERDIAETAKVVKISGAKID